MAYYRFRWRPDAQVGEAIGTSARLGASAASGGAPRATSCRGGWLKPEGSGGIFGGVWKGKMFGVLCQCLLLFSYFFSSFSAVFLGVCRVFFFRTQPSTSRRSFLAGSTQTLQLNINLFSCQDPNEKKFFIKKNTNKKQNHWHFIYCFVKVSLSFLSVLSSVSRAWPHFSKNFSEGEGGRLGRYRYGGLFFFFFKGVQELCGSWVFVFWFFGLSFVLVFGSFFRGDGWTGRE